MNKRICSALAGIMLLTGCSDMETVSVLDSPKDEPKKTVEKAPAAQAPKKEASPKKVRTPKKHMYGFKCDDWIHAAAEHGKIEVIRCWLEEYDLKKDPEGKEKKTIFTKQYDGNNYTAIHYAILNDHVDIVELLLNSGVPIDLPSKDGRPMHLAAADRSLKTLSFLIKKYPELVNKAYPRSKIDLFHIGTPLHAAIYQGQIKAVKMLLENGADPNIKTLNGQSSIALAKKRSYESSNKILLLLKKHGAKE